MAPIIKCRMVPSATSTLVRRKQHKCFTATRPPRKEQSGIARTCQGQSERPYRRADCARHGRLSFACFWIKKISDFSSWGKHPRCHFLYVPLPYQGQVVQRSSSSNGGCGGSWVPDECGVYRRAQGTLTRRASLSFRWGQWGCLASIFQALHISSCATPCCTSFPRSSGMPNPHGTSKSQPK